MAAARDCAHEIHDCGDLVCCKNCECIVLREKTNNKVLAQDNPNCGFNESNVTEHDINNVLPRHRECRISRRSRIIDTYNNTLNTLNSIENNENNKEKEKVKKTKKK